MTSDPVVIAAYARTPVGGFQGVLASLKATELGAAAVRAAVARAGVDPDRVDQCLMGCVLPAGLGQAPARQAAIGGGLPPSTQGATINKMCGSGMYAAMLAHDALVAGSADVVVAGGFESMTNAPYLMTKHRSGARIGHDVLYDHMYLDGLEDGFGSGRLMGAFAEDTARRYQFTREDQDAFALESLARAKAAAESGALDAEIVPLEVKSRKGVDRVLHDEQPQRADPAKIPTLKPAFAPDGTVTAANASSISDGAAALVLTRASTAGRLGLPVKVRVVAHATFAQAPELFTTSPVGAAQRVLAKAGWTVADVDLFEVNEAFAVVAMAAMRDLGIERERINVNGGACAIGHPVGASGARLLGALAAQLEARGLKRGVASICLGGGEATAVALERV